MSGDSFSEVTSQSWFSRIGNAFKGIVIGIVMILIAFGLLFWNEGRAVERYKTLKEGGGAVVSISSDKVAADNQGKLVHLTGLATTEETLTDPTFGVSTHAIKLQRVAMMYQWKEQTETSERKKIGGGTETTTTYTYTKVWSEDLIRSNNFKEAVGHQNPAQMAYPSADQVAKDVTIGAFTMTPSLVGMMRDYTPVSLGEGYTLPDSLREKGRQMGQDTIYLGYDPATPQIGDIKISFREVKPMTVSLVANQVNNTFEPYHAKAGGTIELLESGTHSAEAMFQQAQKRNTIMTWILRALGFVLMFGGFKMVLGPLSVLADVLPILGTIVGAGSGLIALLVAGVLSFITVAVAWIVYRPLVGIVLLAVAGGIGGFMFVKLRKSPAQKPAAAAAPPEPPPVDIPADPGSTPPPLR